MTNDLSKTLGSPDRKKTTKYNLMATISNDISESIQQGYYELAKTMNGGAQKRTNTKAKTILTTNHQVTTIGEKREKKRIWKRMFGNKDF